MALVFRRFPDTTQAERDEGTATAARTFSPSAVADMARTHGGGGIAGVTSFNTRAGTVVPANGDYNADQITETGSTKMMTAAERTKLATLTASQVANVAAGTILATDVQAAIDELDTEKAATTDARFTDARTPTAHASSHKNGGSDEIATATPGTNVIPKTNGTGKLDGWISAAAVGTAGITAFGTSSSAACVGNDSRLSDSRAPTAHATNHKTGGSDAIKLDELAAPTDVTTLNASTSAHGLLKKLDNNAAHFMDGTGAWSPVPYDVLCGIVGLPSNSETVLLFCVPRAFRIPANATGSQFKAGSAATGAPVFSIKKNGTQFLTATGSAGTTTATFSSAQTDFAAGDVLSIVAPSSADATLADIAITLVATLL